MGKVSLLGALCRCGTHYSRWMNTTSRDPEGPPLRFGRGAVPGTTSYARLTRVGLRQDGSSASRNECTKNLDRFRPHGDVIPYSCVSSMFSMLFSFPSFYLSLWISFYYPLSMKCSPFYLPGGGPSGSAQYFTQVPVNNKWKVAIISL